MTRQIIVSINPHEDGVRCGECAYIERCCDDGGCSMAIYPGPWDMDTDAKVMRGPACLAAEKPLSDLREAGEAMKDRFAMLAMMHGTVLDEREIALWDRKLAAIKGEG